MLFSSVIFLFLFLPAVWAAYYLSWKKGRNLVLLLASLVFYVWGGREQVFILLLSVLLNYAIGISFLLLDRMGAARMAGVAASGAPASPTRADRVRRLLLVLGISLNLALLAFYKYFNFLVSNLSLTLGWLGFGPLPMENIIAPLGISFFTFHALSYLMRYLPGQRRSSTEPDQPRSLPHRLPENPGGPHLKVSGCRTPACRQNVDVTGFPGWHQAFYRRPWEENFDRQSAGRCG